MCKQISLVMLLVFVSISFGFNPKFAKPNKLVKAPILVEPNTAISSSSKMYFGTSDGMFDKSANGYGWFLGYNRKVQANFDALTGDMYGSLFRKLNPVIGNGTIGGLTGAIEGDVAYPTFSYASRFVYESSIYQTEGTEPGGRYPYVCEFINGYLFGMFNDYDTSSGVTISQPMFTVCDATFGYDDVVWSTSKRVECVDSNTIISNAWQGTGDVVYDPSTGYYYWTQAWKENLNPSSDSLAVVVGRSMTPADENSWEWTDHNDLRFDCFSDMDEPTLFRFERMHFSYAKDTQGNGTGYGIGVVMAVNSDQTYPRLSYIYTNNWGADDDSGTWKRNWKAKVIGDKFYQVNTADLFDWYGETLTMYDSIGYDIITGEVIYDSTIVTMDNPYMSWNLSAVTTEFNIVHVLIKVFPASSDDTYTIYPWTDNGFRSGYYDVRGEITETGVIWEPAVFVANFVDTDNGWKVEDDGIEWTYSTRNTLSISYNGYGQFMAGWLDKPTSRARPLEPDSLYNLYRYYDDGYVIFSRDDGNSWEHDMVVEVETGIAEDPIWYLKYAGNATNTKNEIDEGWSLSTHGGISSGDAFSYAACQYSDTTGVEETYLDHEQFLSVWCVAYRTVGIQAEEISLTKDFELEQNYPNPFNPETSIQFKLQKDSDVKLSIFNTKGELVVNLKNEKLKKGSHSVNFDATKLNSGIYFYTLKVNNRSESKKMILVK